ncbi:MAG: tRNA (N6-isopentenyl adenosine(37)-C2)-methylthiotransferase MiaB [Verrucomicrobiota bacterium]
MLSVYIKTLGCQMNVRDSEQVSRQLLDRGYCLVEDEKDADVILINTCSVRDQAEQKAIQKMRSLAYLKKKKPQMILGFLGCMAQSRGEELFDQLPDLDLVIGTQKFHRVVDDLEKKTHSGGKILDVEAEENAHCEIRDHILVPPTAFISVMQGCNMHCAFCIVPHTRGKQRSRPIPDILAEARLLVAQGVKEITLLGQIVNLYGRGQFPMEKNRSPFAQLLYELEKIDGLERIRFTSPHPLGMKPDLIQAFRDVEKLCEHVHLPVQSGSDVILKKMKRGHTADAYRKIIDALRAASSEMEFTTDVIVGFPGETEEDFLQTEKLIEDVQFQNAFIFKYSKRSNTPAASLEDQISQSIKEERNERLLRAIDKIAEEKNSVLLGKTVEILVEGPSKKNSKRYTGRTRTNKIAVFPADEKSRGELVNLRIEEATNFTLYGTTDFTDKDGFHG